MQTCVIIPAFNESSTITKIIEKCKKYINDILIIDDGSTDNTSVIAKNTGCTVIPHKKRTGKGASLIDGFRWAIENRFESVITLDADYQHDPDDIPKFLKESEKNIFDIIVGNRMSSPEGMPLLRLIINKFMSKVISRISGQHISDTQCGYRWISTDLLKKISLKTIHYDQESEILIEAGRAGYKIGSVDVKTIYGKGKSTIHPFTDTLRFLKLICKYICTR